MNWAAPCPILVHPRSVTALSRPGAERRAGGAEGGDRSGTAPPGPHHPVVGAQITPPPMRNRANRMPTEVAANSIPLLSKRILVPPGTGRQW